MTEDVDRRQVLAGAAAVGTVLATGLVSSAVIAADNPNTVKAKAPMAPLSLGSL